MDQITSNLQQKIKAVEQSLANWQQQLNDANALLADVQTRIVNAQANITFHRGHLSGLNEALDQFEKLQSQPDTVSATSDNVLEA